MIRGPRLFIRGLCNFSPFFTPRNLWVNVFFHCIANPVQRHRTAINRFCRPVPELKCRVKIKLRFQDIDIFEHTESQYRSLIYLVFIQRRPFFLLAASLCTIIRQRIDIRLLIIA